MAEPAAALLAELGQLLQAQDEALRAGDVDALAALEPGIRSLQTRLSRAVQGAPVPASLRPGLQRLLRILAAQRAVLDRRHAAVQRTWQALVSDAQSGSALYARGGRMAPTAARGRGVAA